jgi:hypothetical protein
MTFAQTLSIYNHPSEAMAQHLAPLPLSTTSAANAKKNGSTKQDDPAHLSGSDHWLRYAQLRGVEDTKNNFIQDILTRYDSVVRQYQNLISQQDARRDSISDLTERELLVCQQNVAHMQRLLDREPFITVLIDGNSLIFKSAFLRDGEKGGCWAAIKLRDEIARWIPDSIISAPAEFRMNIKVYADFRGLAGTLLRNGTIDNLSTLGDFARGFNSLFDFVDIGGGDVNDKLVGVYSTIIFEPACYSPSRTDCLVENLKLCLYDYHCRQVLFGGSSESLDPYSGDEEAKNRVTLLQSTKSDAGHAFKTACFQDIFRSTKIVLPMGYITPRTGTPGSVSGVSNNGYSSIGLPFHDRTNSPASSFASVEPSGTKSWAKLAQAVAPLPQTSAIPRALEEPTPRHNSKGQRIDPPIVGDWKEIQRVKAIKMCNMHYLHPDGCKFSADYCNHRHDYKPTVAEIRLLRSVSRETACRHGVGCDETVCVYGHRCPFPLATEGTMRGLWCINGEKCRFPKDMHGI